MKPVRRSPVLAALSARCGAPRAPFLAGDAVPVTLHPILTGEKHWPEVDPADVPFFVDWLTISQVHPKGGLREVDAGVVWCSDTDGEVEWRTVKALKHVGSFETSLLVRCDGFRVSVSGNLSRFGRADNVFGFGVLECVQRANEVLAAYGLPPFVGGERVEKVKRGDVVAEYTGARISRIDLTCNYGAGSADDARSVVAWLGSQHNGRKSGRVLGQGETVDWGAGSRNVYAKAYIKHLELERHGATGQLVDWCRSVGLVRYEMTVRGVALSRRGCAWLGDYERGWAMGQLVQLFKEHASVMTRAEKSTDDLDELPRYLRATARDYLAGMDCRRGLSTATWYRHRNALLAYGLDIAVLNVRPFVPRVRVVELARVEAPSWYQLAA